MRVIENGFTINRLGDFRDDLVTVRVLSHCSNIRQHFFVCFGVESSRWSSEWLA